MPCSRVFYTLHPIPYTLFPTPYSLHPVPYTLNSTLAVSATRARSLNVTTRIA